MGELTQTFNQVQAILDHAIVPSATMNNGALLVGGSSGTPTTLPIGTAEQVLTVNSGGTNIGWAAAPVVSGGSSGASYIDFTATYSGSYYLVSTSASFSTAQTTIQNGGFLYARVNDVTNGYTCILPLVESGSSTIVFGGDMGYLTKLSWDSSSAYISQFELSNSNY